MFELQASAVGLRCTKCCLGKGQLVSHAVLCCAVPLPFLLRLLLNQGLTPEEIDAFMAQQAAKQQQEDGEA